jgi:hypothetical protein
MDSKGSAQAPRELWRLHSAHAPALAIIPSLVFTIITSIQGLIVPCSHQTVLLSAEARVMGVSLAAGTKLYLCLHVAGVSQLPAGPGPDDHLLDGSAQVARKLVPAVTQQRQG